MVENSSHPDWSKAYQSLTRYLGARDHSEKELREKLAKKYDPSLVEEMIHLAKNQRWLADPFELAERTARRLSEKGKGFHYISRYLQEKGLPTIERDEAEEQEKALLALQTKFGNFDKTDRRQKEKMIRFLSNRGYDSETIARVIYEKS